MRQWCFEVLPPHKTIKISLHTATLTATSGQSSLVRSVFNEDRESGTETIVQGNLLHIAIIGTYKDNTFIQAKGQSALD